jgi:hypothetical protein
MITSGPGAGDSLDLVHNAGKDKITSAGVPQLTRSDVLVAVNVNDVF